MGRLRRRGPCRRLRSGLYDRAMLGTPEAPLKGAALITAEIERIDRAALKGEQPAQPSGSERGEV